MTILLAEKPTYSDSTDAVEISHDTLISANINPITHLATDYLNHFNEVLMLMELLPTMPDMAGDVMTWSPKDYISHFQDSSFQGKELAIAAYRVAPRTVKKPFEQTISEIDAFITEAQRKLMDMPLEDEIRVQLMVEETMALVQPLLGEADRLIHGRDIDFEGDETADTQADIDALFDLPQQDFDELEEQLSSDKHHDMDNAIACQLQVRRPRVRRFLRSRLKRANLA